MARHLVLLALWAFAALPALADESKIPSEHLSEVEALREPERLIETPQAVSIVSREEVLRARPAVDLEEALELVPGVFAQSSRNFAQDTRVSIRGFGSRARFGIRGVRVLVDGVPNTLPDGQTEIDSIDLGFLDRIEVVRGPISSLWGGGGGGLISLHTVPPTEEPTFSARTTFGTDHLSRYQALARGRAADTGYVFGLARTRYSGYRDHARAEQTTLLTKLERAFGEATWGNLWFSSVWSPEGQDPGGLNAAEVSEDRQQARARARLFDTGEKLNQQKLALTLRHAFGPAREVRVTGYTLWRDFSNRLPFEDGGRVDLDRQVSGAAMVFSDLWGPVRWTSGFDIDQQRDHRRRYENLAGARGDLTVRQHETVRSFGPFAQAAYERGPFSAVAGLRYDWTEFDIHDRFTSDGDQSDQVRFRQLSPRFGMRYLLRSDFSIYGNVSTAFEVPTTTELQAPGGLGGLNSRLDPEHALGFELGSKGVLFDRFSFDLALFYIRVRNVLVPIPDPVDPDREIFRNAGKARRRGVELGVSGELRPGASIRVGYTYADYRYQDYDALVLDPAGTPVPVEYDGNREPNNPKHSFAGELRLEHPIGLFAVFSLRHFTRLETNDANTATSDGATVSDARFGYDWTRERLHVRPFFGVRNWSGARYNGTIRPNAAFGRYYEPAPEQQLYGGLNIDFTLAD